MENITSNSYQKFYWMTPMQLRDMFLEEVCFSENTNISILQNIKNLAVEEQSRRKQLKLEFVECPYCKGFHNGFENIDALCEKCEWTVHILQWDANLKQ